MTIFLLSYFFFTLYAWYKDDGHYFDFSGNLNFISSVGSIISILLVFWAILTWRVQKKENLYFDTKVELYKILVRTKINANKILVYYTSLQYGANHANGDVNLNHEHIRQKLKELRNENRNNFAEISSLLSLMDIYSKKIKHYNLECMSITESLDSLILSFTDVNNIYDQIKITGLSDDMIVFYRNRYKLSSGDFNKLCRYCDDGNDIATCIDVNKLYSMFKRFFDYSITELVESLRQ